ncbi:MAG: S41 family peptidase [Ignavibacteriae bacterium]|nr:S41 family peptidase [Ignavibacteria bacterium]MBI3364864.1 S41 family peptidase [Ignavibacteriota bacterium]
MKKRFSVPTVSILIVVALFLGMQINSVISGDNIFEQLNKFKDVLSLTEKYYVDDVDTQKLVESAINGMLSNLDPHSVYIPASQLPKITEDFQGSFEGIGVEYDVINDTLIVVTPVSGGPSEALGILAGDKIVKINDSSAVGIKRDDVPKKLRGPKGTHVKVAIHRPGENNLLDFDITRDKIPLYSVDVSYMIDNKIGYVSVNRFSQTTHDEFVAALDKLKSQGMTKLVLDLRNNPGGYLEQAYKMADELLPKGKKIVYTKGRRPEFDEDYTSQGGRFTDISLIVLVSHGSASASEIVSGAIQDWDRGLIVGETTFGKGLVQRQIDLPDKSAFRLTIARYYTPSGRLIQRPYGKDPDDYRKAAFDKDETEGENIEHSEEKDSTRPIFKTAGGRKVYGGGGITPDYIIKSDKLTNYTIQLLSKGALQEFTLAYVDQNGKQLRQQYEKDMKKYLSDFTVSEEMMKSLEEIAKKKGVTLDQEQYKKDLTYIKARMKAQVARSIWGNEGWFSAMRSEDNQFQKAITLFPEAEKIAGLR